MAAPRPAGFGLVRYFALTGLAAFVLVAAALMHFQRREAEFAKQVQQDQNAFFAQVQDGFVKRYDANARADLLSIHEAGNVNLGRLFSNALWEKDFAPFVAKVQRIPVDHCRSIADVQDAGGKTVQPAGKKACFAEVSKRIMALPEFRALDAKVYETMKKSTVFKIKVFDAKGITAYSSEHKQIGEDKIDNAGWKSAVAGRPASQLTFRGRFSTFEGEVENRNLISSYLPVHAPGGEKIVGVFEVYSDVTPFVAQIKATSAKIGMLSAKNQAQVEQAAAANQAQVDENAHRLLAIVLGLLALLYCVLFLIVRAGQRIIDKGKSERERAEQVRAALAGIVENANDAIISRSLDGTILSWNAGAQRLLGYSAAEALGRPIDELIYAPGVRARTVQNIEKVRRGETVAPYETRRKTKDGRLVDVLSSVSPIRNEAGEVIAASIILHDISALKQAELTVKESEERFRAAFEQAGVGMGLRDIDPSKPQWLRVNQKLCDILGYTREELMQLTSIDVTPPEDRAVAIEQNERLLRGEITTYVREKRYVRKDGQIIWAKITLSAVRGTSGQPGYIISVVEDITDTKKTDERIAYLAQYDALTALPSRTLFRDRLIQAMARAKRNERLLAVMLLDLDRFKEINDSFGHAVGDCTLQAVGNLLKDALREVDTIARMGGDEFALIIEQNANIDEITAVAERIQQVFYAPLVIAGREIFVTTSIGITVYPFNGEDVDELLQASEVALYRAKEDGRNTYEFFTAEMNGQATERLTTGGLLRRGLERGEFVLHYQPKVAVDSGRIIGVEALIRWNSKELGFVSPAKFIPIAEETGLIVPITEWVLKTACAQSMAWQRGGIPPLEMSVNLSPRQFRQHDLLTMIAGVLQETGLAPRYLDLEITEGTVMQHPEKAIAILKELNVLGVQISIDDFGTGYSSLGYLKRFPVQKLKIDQSFIRGVMSDPNDAAIVTAVIAMAKSLNLGLVAEGVETKDQLAFLTKLRCEEYQGYYFSKPLPPEALLPLLQPQPLLAAG